MSYKSILTIWDGKESSIPAIQKAIELTKASDGHLHIVCPAYITILQNPAYPFLDFPKNLKTEERDHVEITAAKLMAEAEKIAQEEFIFYSIEKAIINRDQLAILMAHTAKFCDLAVLPRPFGYERTETDEKIAEGTLLSSECPVLIIPAENVEPSVAKAVIAWDGSNHALRAVRDAMPLLRQTEHVTVAIIANSKRTELEAEVSSDIAVFLARHRINVDVNILSDSSAKISDVIRSHANKLGANLIVMGGYGHSPIREFLFGGPTRNMLQDSRVPIFMAH